MNTTIKITASKSYDVIIGDGLIENAAEYITKVSTAKRAAIITDDNVDPLYGKALSGSLSAAGITSVKFVFPHGEQSKCAKTLLEIYSFLAQNEITRSDLIIALGGGVVGDITGFAAATFLRGVDYIQIPTSLLAQVDSSVGGKTAIDIPEGKNLVGSFNQPLLVLCDISALKTLSDEFFTDGMGEVTKYGMIRSKNIFETIKNGADRNNMQPIIEECVSIKRDIVKNDEFDTGERFLLNFGHTLGHAVEKYGNYSAITHGKAVAVGMTLITGLAESRGMCKIGTRKALVDCLRANGLPFETEIPLSELYPISLGDKKRTTDSLSVVICPEIGESQAVKMKLSEYKGFIYGY